MLNLLSHLSYCVPTTGASPPLDLYHCPLRPAPVLWG